MTQVARLLFACVLALAGTSAEASAQAASPAPAPVPSVPSTGAAGPPGSKAVPQSDAIDKRAKAEFIAWHDGRLDKSQYTPKLAELATDAVVEQVSPQLKSLGDFKAIQFTDAWNYLGVNNYQYIVTCSRGTMLMLFGLDPQGKVAGVRFAPVPPPKS